MTGLQQRAAADPEAVTATTPRALRATLLTQWWRDVVLLHWRADPATLTGFMPPGARRHERPR